MPFDGQNHSIRCPCPPWSDFPQACISRQRAPNSAVPGDRRIGPPGGRLRRFPIKRALGDEVRVEADVFATAMMPSSLFFL